MGFEDLLEGNERFRRDFVDAGADGRATRGLAVVTCIDSRIDPLAILDLRPGDAKIVRNAGARVTDDVLRSLVLASAFLDVERVALVAHTDCRMTRSTDDEMRDAVTALRGVDASDWDFLAVGDQAAVLRDDAERIRACPLLPASLEVGAFIYDLHRGALEPVPR